MSFDSSLSTTDIFLSPLFYIQKNKLHYAEAGSGPWQQVHGDKKKLRLILCLHDFGDFWFGFRRQLESAAAAEGEGSALRGCWVVALDMKGIKMLLLLLLLLFFLPSP